MRKTLIALATLALVMVLGCKKTENASYTSTPSSTPSVAQATNLSPEELGKLGAEIKKHPKEANKLLSEKGLTEQSFTQAVRKVAESPEDSKRYAQAYKKAS